MASGDSSKRWLLPATSTGQRLDWLVKQLLPELSRHELAELFAQGRVRCRGHALKKGDLARAGQELEIVSPPSTLATDEANEAPLPELKIVAETAAWVVCEKAAGVPSVPRRGFEPGCVASALLQRYPEMRAIGYRESEGGLLSRLDTQTSGLLLAARTRWAFEALQHGARTGLLHKYYQAFVAAGARLSRGTVDVALGPERGHARRVATAGKIRGRAVEAQTELLEIESLPRATRVVLKVTTAYRHQVRAHLAHLGWPLLGDVLYGGLPLAGQRHALHAHRVTWNGSPEIPAWDVSVPLADDLSSLLS